MNVNNVVNSPIMIIGIVNLYNEPITRIMYYHKQPCDKIPNPESDGVNVNPFQLKVVFSVNIIKIPKRIFRIHIILIDWMPQVQIKKERLPQ